MEADPLNQKPLPVAPANPDTDAPLVSRKRLAAPDMLDCARETVAYYQRLGMPFVRHEGGRRVWYNAETCMAWALAQRGKRKKRAT